MLSLVAPIGILLVGTLVTRHTIGALVAAILAAAALHSNFSAVQALHLLTTFSGDVLFDVFNAKLLAFILLIGVFTALVEHTGVARAFELSSRRLLTSVKRAEFFVATTAFGLGIDDYFNSLTRSLLVRDACDHAGIARRRVSYLVHASALAVPVLLPISTAALFIIGLLRAIPAVEAHGAIVFYLSLVPALAFPTFAVLTTLACSWPRAASDHRLPKADSEEMALADGRPMAWAVGSLFAGTLVALPLSGLLFGARNLADMLILADVSGALLTGVLVGIATAAWFARHRFACPPKTLVKLAWRGTREMAPVLVMILLSWLLGKMTNHAVESSTLLPTLFASDALPQSLLPGLIFVVAGLFTFVIGGAWSAWAVLVPLLVPLLAVHAPDQLALATAALLSGVVLGETLCPFSDLSILISQAFEISVGEHIAAQVRLTLVAGVAALAAHVVMGHTGSVAAGMGVGMAVWALQRPWRG